jgi:hypothetical protein
MRLFDGIDRAFHKAWAKVPALLEPEKHVGPVRETGYEMLSDGSERVFYSDGTSRVVSFDAGVRYQKFGESESNDMPGVTFLDGPFAGRGTPVSVKK